MPARHDSFRDVPRTENPVSLSGGSKGEPTLDGGDRTKAARSRAGPAGLRPIQYLNGFGREDRMLELFQALWTDESGQDLAEYALLIALIALAVIVAVTLLGTTIRNVFNTIGSTLSTVPTTS
jgi:pilus assembly protein Flp/PilA